MEGMLVVSDQGLVGSYPDITVAADYGIIGGMYSDTTSTFNVEVPRCAESDMAAVYGQDDVSVCSLP